MKEKEGQMLPAKPYGLKISDISRDGIVFYWKKLPGVSGYEVFRSYNSDGPFELIRQAKTWKAGTHLDSDFDHARKSVYYTLRSYITDENGKAVYSEIVEPVEAKYVETLCMDRAETYLYDGTQRRLKALYGWGEPEDGVWSSTDESVATVDQNGVITGVSAGSCEILYTSASAGAQTSSRVVVNRQAEEMLHQFPIRFRLDPETGNWKNPEADNTGTAVIMMVGDLMCGKAQMKKQQTPENGWDFTDSFEFVREITRDSDFAVGNLETLLAPGWPYMLEETYIDNYNNCNATPRYLEAVRYGGFDAVVMANNHNCDGGVRALLETVDQTDRYQFAHTGVFRSENEERFFIADVNGIRVGFLAYMTRETGFNGKDKDWTEQEKAVHLNVFTPEKARADIAACRARGAEYVVVYMHWGDKNFRKPTRAQLRDAQSAADAGADYIVGANPHLTQFYDLLRSADGRDVPCFYSTGNFQSIMNQVPGNRDSVLVCIRLVREASGQVVLAGNHYLPCHAYRSVADSNWAPVALSAEFNSGVPKVKRIQFYEDLISTVGPKIGVLSKRDLHWAVPTEKVAPPNRNSIRRVMQATGWSAYETYCRMAYISRKKDVTFEEILQDKLWTDYREEEALSVLGKVPVANFHGIGLMDQAEFETVFYTPKQKKSIQAISEGRLTARVLFEYMGLTVTEIPNLDLDADITDRITTTLSEVRPGSIFICTRKKDIIPESILRRKPACIISYRNYQPLFGNIGIPFFGRPNLITFLLDLAELWKKRFPAKTVAITGSVGKTTTTDMIAQVFDAAFCMHRLTGNQNTTPQIAQFVFGLKEEHEVYVQECSGAAMSQLANSGRILHPDCFVLTNVGNSHLANFQGKKELLSYGKTSLDRTAAPGAFGVINWDNEYLRSTRYRHPVIRCSLSNPAADIISENIEEKDGMISFDVVERNADGKRTHVQLQMIGAHNVYNALSAFAVGVQMGVPREVIVKALADYRPDGVRQSLVSLNGQNVFIDCYNASLESITAAVTAMRSIQCEAGKKKVAVLGDVLELGEDSERLHREIGRAVAEIGSVDEVLFYGPEMRYAMEEASGKIPCRHTEDREELLAMIRAAAPETGLILFKASHGMAFQRVIDDIYGSDCYAEDEAARNVPVKKVSGGEYSCIPDYGCVFKVPTGIKEHAVFPVKVADLPVRILGREAFEGSGVQSAVLPELLECISEDAFRSCSSLREVEFPETLKCIRTGAFRDCESLEILDLSRGCGTIEAEAFAGCCNLRAVFLPDSLLTISDAAFDANTLAVFCCHSGSYAEAWARRNHHRVITM